METLTFESKEIATGNQVTETAFHDTDLENRNGYDSTFLSENLPLPTLKSDLKSSIAINHKPGPNGNLYLDYTHFSILFNKDKKLPFYAAVNIEGKSDEIAKVHEERSGDVWYNDDRLELNKNNFQYKNSDYTHSGFQRGHMVRFYDPAWGESENERKVAMGDTFHFTNCCPQIAKLNAGIWNDLEDYYMARSIFQDNKVTVFTGPIFNKAKTINSLLVPLNFWKVIVYNNSKGIEALGFLISHEIALKRVLEKVIELDAALLMDKKKVQPTLKKEDIEHLFNERGLKKWMVRINLIEEKTGINFGLNSIDHNRFEKQLFHVNANHINAQHPTSEFEEFISKNINPSDLIDKPARLNSLMQYNQFVNERRQAEEDYTEFIKNI